MTKFYIFSAGDLPQALHWNEGAKAGAVLRTATCKPGRRRGWKIKLPCAYPNCCERDLSIQEPGISNFEHAYVRITWDNSLEKRLNWDIPGYPWNQRICIPTYPDLYRLIPTYTKEGYPGISHYKNLILGYPKTTFLSLLILGYPGISHSSGYPWIFRYKSGYGRVSFFQMIPGYPSHILCKMDTEG